MANIKSQIKRNRQNEKRRLRNRGVRGSARSAVREAKAAIDRGDAVKSQTTVLEAIRALDKAAEKGVIHKNNAARRKSRLMKHFASMEPREQEPEKVKSKPIETPAEPEPQKTTRGKAAAAKKPTAAKKTAAKKPASSKKTTSKTSATKKAPKKK